MRHIWLKARTASVGLLFVFGYAAIAWVIAPSGSPVLQAAVLCSAGVFLVGEYITGTRAALRGVAAEDIEEPAAHAVLERLSDDMDVSKPDLKVGLRYCYEIQ